MNNAGYDLLSQTPTVQINNDSQQNSYMNNSIANKYLSHYSRNEGTNPETFTIKNRSCLLYTSPSPRDLSTSRMPSSA